MIILKYIKAKLDRRKATISLSKRENDCILHVENKTNYRVWFAIEPCVQLHFDTSGRQLGKTTHQHISKSKVNVEYPTEYKGTIDFVFKKAQVRSTKQFMNAMNIVVFIRKAENNVYPLPE